MRASGVRGLLIYCSDYKCSRSTAISADRGPDDVRLSDIERLFSCQGLRPERLRTSAQTFTAKRRPDARDVRTTQPRNAIKVDRLG
jgi:hypothetical protein